MGTTRVLAVLLACLLMNVGSTKPPTSSKPLEPTKTSMAVKPLNEVNAGNASTSVKRSETAEKTASTKPSEATKKPATEATKKPTPATSSLPSLFQGGQGGTSLQLQLGAGCILSNYSALPVVALTAGTDAESLPSFRVALTPGFGFGEYVVHFSAFQLPPEDVIIVHGYDDTSGSTGSSVVLSGSNSTGAFYATTVTGSGVELSLYRTAETPIPPTQTARGVACYGFKMDEIQFRATESFSKEASEVEGSMSEAAIEMSTETVATMDSVPKKASRRSHADESVCGKDESVEAVCAPSLAMRNSSQGVARLTIVKDNNMDVAYCTGFLIGCEGHLITNQHCIGSWVDALNTAVEFHAESPVCGENCTSRAACPGNVIVRSTTLVAVSEELDYALVSLVNASSSMTAVQEAAPLLAAAGGYLQFRSTGPVEKEQIYVAQHPMGYGKRLAWTNSGQPGRIESLSVDACRAGDVGYYVDTQEGSSGSPVIATSDNAVVALHHCGGCLNGAIPSETIIADMKTKGVLPACAIRDT